MSERLAQLALDTLRACEGEHSVVAGRRHFVQYWLRDSCFAHWGHLALSEHDVVEKAVRLFTDGVNGGGHVPLRYGDKSMFIPLARDVLTGFKGFRMNEPHHIARYGDDKGWAEVIDSTPLLVVLAGLNALSGGVVVDYEALDRAMKKHANRERFGLLIQRPYADWCDSVKRRGYVTYTNAIYYAALRTMSLLAPDSARTESYAQKAVEVRDLINERLWMRAHYAEYVDEVHNKRIENFSVESNFLCMLFGIADEKKRDLIFSTFDRYPELVECIGRRVAPRYPAREVSRRMRLVGMKDYHDRMQWIWTTGLILLADRQVNGRSRTDAIIERLESLLEGADWVSEVYVNNKPFRTPVYRSEEPFAWSAGMLVAGLVENEELDEAFAKIRG